MIVVTEAVAVHTTRDFAQSLVQGKRQEDYTATQDRVTMMIKDARHRFLTQGQQQGAASVPSSPVATDRVEGGGSGEMAAEGGRVAA